MLENIEQRQAMLAAIIDSSEDAIISKDLNSTIMSWNNSAERMFGYAAAEVTGKHINILIPEERRHEEELIIAQLKAGKRIEHFETVRRAKNGELLNISLTISPIRNNAGQIVGASKIARDITRQKRNEEMLQQYARRLELINSVGKSISTQLDVTAILQKVTDATTSLSGAAFGAFFYNRVDAKGETYMLYALSGAPREAFESLGMPRNTAVFAKTFSGDGIVRSDDIRKDPRYGHNKPHHGMPEGHLPVVSYLAVPVVSQSGVVIGGLFFGHPDPAKFSQDHEDLVSSIAAQAAITLDNAKLYEEVQALSNKKDEFLGFASHELKTPLTTLSGYLQLAKRAPETAPVMIDKLEKQVERLRVIIGDLLEISKISSGNLQFNFARTSLNSLLHECIKAVDYGSHVFTTELPSEDILVMIDASKMMQVITNLLTNAVKYSAVGTGVEVAAELFGDEVKISIRDHGSGIPAAELDKIFNRFYRVMHSPDRAEGVGLGLFISRELIEGHMGKIWAESEEGKGSKFFVTFPVDRGKI